MQGSSESLHRTRQACGPCRRKKTKCDGQRPSCSFCRRLNQTCTYGNRHDSNNNVNKDHLERRPGRDDPQKRLQVLESHVEQIYDLLKNVSEKLPCTINTQNTDHVLNETGFASPEADTSIDDQSAMISSSPTFWHSIRGFDESVIHRAVQVYAKKIHCQPLPLFETADLASRIFAWPEHLTLNFLVTITRLSPDIMSSWTAQERQHYHKKGEHELMAKLSGGRSSLEILESLCLLIVEEVAVGEKAAAWMHIGIGARLAIAENHSWLKNKTDAWARVCWSLYALDRMYGSSFSMAPAFPNESGLPSCPPSHHIPQAKNTTTSSEVRQTRPSPAPEGDARTDIDASCFCLLSVWGDAVTYVQSVKDNESLVTWSENSQYPKLVAKLYTFEITIGRVHRVRSARPDARLAEELEDERGYWAPWITMQLLYHTVQVLINHPFLHLAKKQKDHIAQPPSFLQRTVDQVLLHSGWVTRFISLCDEKEFVINDPFIAHLASIVATSFMFFLNANDTALAQQAHRGFGTCCDFIQKFAATWPHTRDTIHKLNILKTSINDQSSVNSAAAAPSIQASLLWSLFDYSSSTTPSSMLDMSSSRVELSTTTQFLSPIESVTTPQARQGSIAEVAPATNSGVGQRMSDPTDSIFDNDISLFDPMLLANIHTSNFGDDFYGEFGQL